MEGCCLRLFVDAFDFASVCSEWFVTYEVFSCAVCEF